MLLRMEGGEEARERTECKGRLREVMLQRCDTESITPKGKIGRRGYWKVEWGGESGRDTCQIDKTTYR